MKCLPTHLTSAICNVSGDLWARVFKASGLYHWEKFIFGDLWPSKELQYPRRAVVTYTTYGQLLIIPSLSHDASTVNKFSHKFSFTFYCREEFFPARYSIQFLNFPLFSLPCCKEEFFLAIQASYPNSIIPIQLIIFRNRKKGKEQKGFPCHRTWKGRLRKCRMCWSSNKTIWKQRKSSSFVWIEQR